MKRFHPALIADFYKLTHPEQYPKGTEFVSSNTTPRGSRMEGVNDVVVFGLQYLIQEYLIDHWNEEFFKKPKEQVVSTYKRFVDCTLGKDAINVDKIGALHDLGYLPLLIKALPEGTSCPLRVPLMTIINTKPEFYWLTNFVETLTQTVIWQAITSATIAREYNKLLNYWAQKTSSVEQFVMWQGHDFSMRGMSSVETGAVSAAAHLLSFNGTDSATGIMFLEEYYGANIEKEMVGSSVPATEHAVMCAGGSGLENEYETFRRIIEDIYPSGIVSIVSDTWDFWKVLTKILPALKFKIMGRNGKVVIRPDSGDPVKIITGYFPKAVKYSKEEILNASMNLHMKIWDGDHDAIVTPEGIYLDKNNKELSQEEIFGAMEILRQEFGGTLNSKGYIELDPHIGLIYGDSITLTRCAQICERLAQKGFASTNMVFGIGSYTYQYNTRDTFSIACKATWVQINGEGKAIFKDPITDDGHKKSACGLLSVLKDENGKLYLKDNCTPEEELGGELRVIFRDSCAYNTTTLEEVRERLKKSLLSM